MIDNDIIIKTQYTLKAAVKAMYNFGIALRTAAIVADIIRFNVFETLAEYNGFLTEC